MHTFRPICSLIISMNPRKHCVNCCHGIPTTVRMATIPFHTTTTTTMVLQILALVLIGNHLVWWCIGDTVTMTRIYVVVSTNALGKYCGSNSHRMPICVPIGWNGITNGTRTGTLHGIPSHIRLYGPSNGVMTTIVVLLLRIDWPCRQVHGLDRIYNCGVTGILFFVPTRCIILTATFRHRPCIGATRRTRTLCGDCKSIRTTVKVDRGSTFDRNDGDVESNNNEEEELQQL